MVSGVESIAGGSGAYAAPTTSKLTTEEAIAQAQRTMSESTISLFSVPAPDAGTYSYRMIYDSSFVKAITSSNGQVAATGNGQTILPYGDSKAAIEAATQGMKSSVDAIYTSVRSMLSEEWGTAKKTRQWDMSSMVIASIYAKAGYQPESASNYFNV